MEDHKSDPPPVDYLNMGEELMVECVVALTDFQEEESATFKTLSPPTKVASKKRDSLLSRRPNQPSNTENLRKHKERKPVKNIMYPHIKTPPCLGEKLAVKMQQNASAAAAMAFGNGPGSGSTSEAPGESLFYQ